MTPKLVTVSTFSVTGVEVRTINSDEFNPTSAKLPGFWGQFFENGVPERVPNQVPNSPIFGVYSNYESDASGFYSVTAGVATSGSRSSEFTTVDVQEGKYLVFENKGEMPQAIIDTWVYIWNFFEKNDQFSRSFATDFEEYRSPDEIAIHIGVKSKAKNVS